MRKNLQILAEYLFIFSLAVISALEYMIFIEKNQFAPSGLIGIATMVQHVFGFSVGYMTFLINAPLCVIAYIFLGRKYAIRTVVYVTVFSEVLLLMQNGAIDVSMLIYETSDNTSRLLSPIASGVIGGIGYGAVLRASGSTGGVDIIASLMQRKRSELNLVWIIFAFNVAVAVISYFVYGYDMQPVILCVIYSFIVSEVSDSVLSGGKTAVKFEVVTDFPDALRAEIASELGRGATIIKARGAYTNNKHHLMICIVAKHQITKFNRILKKYEGTFAYLSPVSEVVGDFDRRNRRK